MTSIRYCIASVFSILLAAAAIAQSQSAVALPPANTVAGALDHERQVVASAKELAVKGDVAGAAGLLNGVADSRLKPPVPVLAMRRAWTLCASLRNDNQLGVAMKIAAAALNSRGRQPSLSDSDQVEFLYFQGLLMGDILNQKPEALGLLRQAENLAPRDNRITEVELRYVQALSFSREN